MDREKNQVFMKAVGSALDIGQIYFRGTKVEYKAYCNNKKECHHRYLFGDDHENFETIEPLLHYRPIRST